MYFIEIEGKKFRFDQFGQGIGPAPLTFGWAWRNGVWDDLFPFPHDDRIEDDLAAHAGQLWPGLLQEEEALP